MHFVRHMKTKNLIIIVVLLLLYACGGGGTSTTPPTSTSLPPNPVINEDTSAGLKGVDANANGIRDDIDQLISQKFSKTPEIKKAAEQDARATQQMLEATTREEALVAGEQIGRAIACKFKMLPGVDDKEHYKLRRAISREIEALTANTRERIKKYLESNKLAGGGYFTKPQEPVCD